MRSTLLFLLVVLLYHQAHAQKDFYSQRWSDVYKNEIKNLPQSALKIVDTIYYQAKKDKNVTEITKAVLYQSKFALILQENAELVVVEKFKMEIEASQPPLRNVLESMLAQVYWQYFQMNRWKYYGRSVSSTVSAADFRTWDAAAILRGIEQHYQRSLNNKNLLQNTRLETFDDILALAEHSRRYRPTLYDFLAHYALDFYATDEAALRSPGANNTFEVGHYFSPIDAASFNDSTFASGQYEALKLYKEMLAFHRQRRDTNAYVNLEIERLKFVAAHSAVPGDDALLKNALTSLKRVYNRHAAATLIDLELAMSLFNEGTTYDREDTTHRWKKKLALQICNDAASRFPGSDGAKRCDVLAGRILAQALSIKGERFLPLSRPSRLLMSFTNVSNLFIHIYPLTAKLEDAFFLEKDDSLRIALLTNKVVDSLWQVVLPKTDDYQNHSTELVLPALSRGNYLIVASENRVLSGSTGIFAFTSVRATDLAFLEVQSDNILRFQVINRNNGKPIAGADVHVLSTDTYSGAGIDEHKLTDKNGFIEIDKVTKRGWNLEMSVIYNGDTVSFGDYYYYHYQHDEQETGVTAKSFLFTDRSIYRPGQTVFFKGVLIKTKDKKSSIVVGQHVEVFLEDSRSSEIATLRVKTNGYGSFSGEFKLPAAGLTGEYSLYADEDSEDDSQFYENLDDFDYDETTVSVEEYKRPTFEVSMQPLTGTFRLNDTLRITGNAVAYSGSKITKAKVAYTVKREVRYPGWYYWRSSNPYSPEAEIVSGEVYTNEKGEFTVPFKAVPDIEVSPTAKPVFTYSIAVDVTDITGETRSAASSVKVGYHSMLATVRAPAQVDVQKPVVGLSITTENLNGQFLPAAGTVKIYKLQGPIKPIRKRPWAAPDYPTLTKETFERLFPNDSYGDDAGSAVGWPHGKLMKELLFDTKTSREQSLTLDKTWQIGSYVMELYTKDSIGQTVEDKFMIEVVDSKGSGVPDNALLIFQTDKTSYKPGEVAKVTIGSAATDVSITVEVEKNNKIVKTYTEQVSNSTKVITVPLVGTEDEGLSIHCNAVIVNSVVERHKRIIIEQRRPQIAIETETFKDKIQPGAIETWSFTIQGKDEQKLQAEVVAAMYDASLDQFKPHDWSFNPISQLVYYSQYRLGYGQSFGVTDFIVKNVPYRQLNIPRQNYDGFDSFGFNLTNSGRAQRKYLERLYVDVTSIGKASKVTMSHDRMGRAGFISGQLTTSDGDVLPGVNVMVKGTWRGTVTDVEGYYSIEAGMDDVLIFSFVGYSSAEVKAGKKNIVDVSMEPDIMQLSEVVVVGYGTQVKKSLTGSVAMVTDQGTVSDVVLEEALAGRMPGVFVRGADGSRYTITIRGTTSLPGGNAPLYVVDGVIVESSQIDQRDLASAQVLKGAAAIAIYGARASNGVIIISTRSGQQKLDNEMAKVNARKDFNETAFFYPHMSTDENGRIHFSFSTPETLTRWKVQLLAHTKDLLTATKTLQAVTQKDLMVTPNLPRFVRVGDEVIISAKVANLSNKKLQGKIVLQLTNPVTGQAVDALFANHARNQAFRTNARGNTQVSWSLKVPPGIAAVQYKIVAKAGSFSDGEQNIVPVLQNRVLVTETLPLYVRSNQTKSFSLTKLQQQSSPTLQHHQLTLEVTSNPAWYALQSLPYLMEFPHECAEQLFSRYYANSIASHVVNSNPKVKAVFDTWAASGKLTSDLEKNQELKSIIIEETPWLRDAESETEGKKRMALLFDLASMGNQLKGAVQKLKDMQFADGGFSWFAGARWPNRYITQHVASGFGHLTTLKIHSEPEMQTMMVKAVHYLDGEVVEDFNGNFLESYTPTSIEVHYLYMRSFYPEIGFDDKTKEVARYMEKQITKKWQEYRLYEKGMIALILYRAGNKNLACDILASLKENAIISDELGMYWKENTGGWYWYESEVETQALLIEAFAEIQADAPKLSVEEKQTTIDALRVWLLKNKQTNAWRTTKATTEAVFALLLQGSDWLSIGNSVDVTVGKMPVNIDTTEPEAGTGYFKTSWKREAVTPDMATVTLSKKDGGVAWGGLYWQYFEDLDKITPAETPLRLKKNVFKVVHTDKGDELHALKDETLKPGDLIRIRIELATDRAMEYLHMKDMRAAGFEPVDVLSEYKWQEGLGYYQSTRDVATHFFFDRVQKGVYVFEYDLRVNVRGVFSNGITTIQSMYAPEFSSHSEGVRVTIE
ncbi:carboxypeptidase-like regulatory domain-containing protein [Fulvivirgaceae bacterium PWU5]|uniref:Carboxypeptidase-like regulatory domain-containing protein n=1 Tax=Dawidia cretensis TaxID=2782350 RepID=A0AAP2DW64_9BACT|nr:MG2 domain-containing protein [Dawidia cretensis]MBT1707343.1 carboxypeptidase-like regulatory domain-containing protein [Dawidia cretensis]